MKAFSVFILGLLLALGGVGAVEHSLTDLVLLQGFVVSLAGCAIMAAGVSYLKENA